MILGSPLVPGGTSCILPPAFRNAAKQDHRGMKQVTRPAMEFYNFHSAQKTLAGIELIHMIKKWQMKKHYRGNLSPDEKFYALTG